MSDEPQSNTVRVLIGLDYETGDYSWWGAGPTEVNPDIIEVNAEQLERWRANKRACEQDQKEMDKLYNDNRSKVEKERETLRLRHELDAAQAAYDTHLHKTAEETGQ